MGASFQTLQHTSAGPHGLLSWQPASWGRPRAGCRPWIRSSEGDTSSRSRNNIYQSRSGLRVKAVATAEETSASELGAATQSLSLAFGTYSLPHPDKASYGGEDAHFVSSTSLAFGVADGVGGWSADGINPADYSQMLMRLVQESLDAAVPSQPSASNIESASSNTTGQSDAPADSMPSQLPSNEAASPAAQSQESRPANESSAQSGVDSSNGKIIDTSEGQSSNMEQKPEVPPIQLLRDALNHAHKGTRLPGSSTACVLQLNAAASNVNAAVLGDSVFIHVRDREILNRGRAGLHFFDCPFQFGNAPEHTTGTDTAEDADITTFDVRLGDIIIVATDGIWDNMQDADMLEFLPTSSSGLHKAAEDIGELASRHAVDTEYDSPYAAEARKAGHDLPWWEKALKGTLTAGGFKPAQLTGGKVDDITVVIGMVTSS